MVKRYISTEFGVKLTGFQKTVFTNDGRTTDARRDDSSSAVQ